MSFSDWLAFSFLSYLKEMIQKIKKSLISFLISIYRYTWRCSVKCKYLLLIKLVVDIKTWKITLAIPMSERKLNNWICIDNTDIEFNKTIRVTDKNNSDSSNNRNNNYRKISNIRRTKSQNWTASHFILQLYLPNPLKPGVKLRMKM